MLKGAMLTDPDCRGVLGSKDVLKDKAGGSCEGWLTVPIA